MNVIDYHSNKLIWEKKTVAQLTFTKKKLKVSLLLLAIVVLTTKYYIICMFCTVLCRSELWHIVKQSDNCGKIIGPRWLTLNWVLYLKQGWPLHKKEGK